MRHAELCAWPHGQAFARSHGVEAPRADVTPLTETVIVISAEEGVANEESWMAAQQLNWTQGRVVHWAGWWSLNGAWWRCFDRPWGRTLHWARGRALYGPRRRSVDRARWWPFDWPWGRALHGTRWRTLYGARRRSVDRTWRWTVNRPQALLQQHPAAPRVPEGAQEARLCGRVRPSSPGMGDQRERTAVALPDVANSVVHRKQYSARPRRPSTPHSIDVMVMRANSARCAWA